MSASPSKNPYAPPTVSLENPNQLLQRNKVRIKFADLNPGLKKLIKPIFFNRFIRYFGEGLTVGNALIFPLSRAAVVSSLGMIGGLSMRVGPVYRIHKLYREVTAAIQTKGLLDSSAVVKYPTGWTQSNAVAQTHPIFAIGWNGDLIFIKPSWAEYQGYKQQQRFLGKAGLHFGRWRGYLEIPESFKPDHAKVMEKRKRKLAYWAAIAPKNQRRRRLQRRK